MEGGGRGGRVSRTLSREPGVCSGGRREEGEGERPLLAITSSSAPKAGAIAHTRELMEQCKCAASKESIIDPLTLAYLVQCSASPLQGVGAKAGARHGGARLATLPQLLLHTLQTPPVADTQDNQQP